jgi:hypothetical protein
MYTARQLGEIATRVRHLMNDRQEIKGIIELRKIQRDALRHAARIAQAHPTNAAFNIMKETDYDPSGSIITE